MSEQTKAFLPNSGDRYSVDVYGHIFDNETDTIIEPYLVDNEYYVDLHWIVKQKSFPVGLVILVGFRKLKIDLSYYPEIKIIYKDGNTSNLLLSNLTYKFRNGPLEFIGRPGFYHIPLYPNYAISKDGNLISLLNAGNYKKWTILKGDPKKNKIGGYVYSRVEEADGESTLIFKHRAIGLAFLSYETDPEKLTVNHKDGNPLNNDLSNLEWISYRDNNLHAINTGLRNINLRAIIVTDDKTKKEMKFPTAASCARSFNLPSSQWLVRNITRGNGLFQYNNKTFEVSKEAPVITRRNPGTAKDYFENDYHMMAKNIFTGKVILFFGADAGEEITKVPRSLILNNAIINSIVPENGYIFRYTQTANDWPTYTSEQIEIFRKYGNRLCNGAYVYDTLNQSSKFYPSLALALNKLGVNPSYYSSYVNTNRLIKNRYIVDKYDLFKGIEDPSPLVE